MTLSPSARVRIICEVGRRLGGAEWSVIYLTLRQFNFPNSDWHDDDRQAYVMRMIEDGDDDLLLSLGRHLNYEFIPPNSTIEPIFWKSDFFRLFISHLAKHRRFVADIQDKLLALGISSFVAHNDIEPTREWQDEIETALATSDGMLALLHPGFHESKWTDQEIGYAMGRQVLIVAARFGTDPYGFIGRFQGMNGNGKSASTVARELFDILRKHAMTRARIAEAVAALFCQSNSFANTRSNMKLLESVSYWDRTLSDRVRAASESNLQIWDAVWQWNPEIRMPQRLDALLPSMENR